MSALCFCTLTGHLALTAHVLQEIFKISSDAQGKIKFKHIDHYLYFL